MPKLSVKKCNIPATDITALYGCEKPLAYALYHRNIRNSDAVKRYVNTAEYPFEPITKLKGVKEAFEILSSSIKKKDKIYIYGDYDADGVMSTTIMYKGLKALGAHVHYFIPDRVEDGYGLNESVVKRIIAEGTDLIITCDNGITAVKQLELAKNSGVKTIVLDHHETAFEETNEGKRDILPSADALVDAMMQDCGFSFTEMCAGGLCYRFICGFYEYLGVELKNKNEFLELAAVATICDVVALKEDNRAIAAEGLRLMSAGSSNIGLKALIELKELKKVTSYAIGFVIGPCINASGRLDSASIAVELFITEDVKRAKQLAEKLNDFNEERKAITVDAFEKISANIEASSLIDDKVIVVYDKDTHESVAGIIAGRIREKYNRPAIVITRGEKCCKGSGRSIEKYDMVKSLYSHKDLMVGCGGHKLAAGLSIEEENIDKLRIALNESCMLTEDDMVPLIRLDAVLNFNDITIKAADELNILSPFGKANEMPVFGILNAIAENIRFVGTEGKIVSLVLTDGNKSVRAVDFNNYEQWIERLNKGSDPIKLDVVFSLEVNEYIGYRNPQLVLKAVRFS